jgi:putative ABC transport system ATP-binding protein
MELLDTFQMADKANSQPARLSAGECQRVALARALSADPAVIFADEPTASLDADNGRHVIGLLQRLTKEHDKTVVVVTHDQRVFSMADRICRIDDGRVVEGADKS